MRPLFTILFLLCISNIAKAQKNIPEITIGLFNTINKDHRFSSNPFISVSLGDYYIENRYNYEADNSTSINFGKRIFKKAKNFYIIPTIGLVVGSFKGATVELQTLFDNKHWYISADNQLSADLSEKNQGFFFNWSILRYKITPVFRVGVSCLYAEPFLGDNNFQAGATASAKFKNIGISFYAFSYNIEQRNYLLSFRYTFKINRFGY